MENLVIDVIIKFGGSAITDKNSLETLLPWQLEQAAKHVKRCTDAGLTCVIVHGAGSFGHHQAKQYAVNAGLTGEQTDEETRSKLWGFCVTRQAVTKLNKYVVDALLDAGVLAVSCSSGSTWQTADRDVVRWPADSIADLLRRGFVPVLHGDCALDAKLGICILSGDTIIKTLCARFCVKRVVFLTDVAGVYDRPPTDKGARLLPHISVRPDGSVKLDINTSQSEHDVTGGIRLKLQTAVDIVRQTCGKCAVVVCRVDSPGVFDVCRNGDVVKDLELTVVAMEDTTLTS